MINLRRNYIEGGTYFFTVVTGNRAQFLTKSFSRKYLRQAFNRVRKNYPFNIVAMVLLPDHLHCILELPDKDSDFSTRWRLIKKHYSQMVKPHLQMTCKLTDSKVKKQESGVWQRRFWEHAICDENDLQNHFDYIHFNPLKHGLVDKIENWQWSTYHKYLKMGYYDESTAAFDFDMHPDVGKE